MKLNIVSKLNKLKSFIKNNKTFTFLVITGATMIISVLIQQIYMFMFALLMWSIPLPICIILCDLQKRKQINK